jgi:hypothetical protein
LEEPSGVALDVEQRLSVFERRADIGDGLHWLSISLQDDVTWSKSGPIRVRAGFHSANKNAPVSFILKPLAEIWGEILERQTKHSVVFGTLLW